MDTAKLKQTLLALRNIAIDGLKQVEQLEESGALSSPRRRGKADGTAELQRMLLMGQVKPEAAKKNPNKKFITGSGK